MASRDDLVAELEAFGCDTDFSDDVFECMTGVMESAKLTVDELVADWVEFCDDELGDVTAEITLTRLKDFHERLLKQRTREPVDMTGDLEGDSVKNVPMTTDNLASFYGDGDDMDMQLQVNTAPLQQQNTRATPKQSLSSAFQRRVNITPQLVTPVSPISTPQSARYLQKKPTQGLLTFGNASVENQNTIYDVKLRVPESAAVPLLSNYKFMYQKRADVATVQLDRIAEMSHELSTNCDDVDTFVEIGMPLGQEAWVCGQVCQAFNTDETKLSSSSLCVQGTSGRRVQVALASSVQPVSLFPGQIVAMNGICPTGRQFEASRIITGLPPLEQPQLPASANGLDIMLASGPFTTKEDLSYAPLNDLLQHVRKFQPSCLILIGPFLDCDHPEVQNGDLADCSYDEFVDQLLANIDANLAGTPTQVLIVSSPRDFHLDCVYPTPPFMEETVRKCIRFVSDPCMVDVNGLLIGITSVDILRHMRAQELNIENQTQRRDMAARLTQHILSQRSFYPLYPPNETVSIDYLQLERHGYIQQRPHVLVTPSSMAPFAKQPSESRDTLAVNPGYLAKGEVNGSYCRLRIALNADENAVDFDPQTMSTCQIIRL